MMMHQSHWQKRMLEIYGRDICLLDATYHTTYYDVPLYFVCVSTNVGFVNVAAMLLSNDKVETIAAA